MSKKAMFFFLIIIAFVFIFPGMNLLDKISAQSDYVTEADIESEIEMQRQIVITQIEFGKDAEAQEACEKLIADYGDNNSIVSAVYEIGEKFREKGRFREAINIHQFITDNFPDNEKAVFAQRSLACSYIGMANLPAANVAIDKLFSDYEGNPNTAQAVFESADAYYWFGKYKEALPLYEKVIDKWPDAEHAMWSQMGIAIANIADGNGAGATAATNKLITNYTNNPKIAEALTYIGGRYFWDKKYVQAEDIYEYITIQFPQSTWASNAKYDSAKVKIYEMLDKNDEPNALPAIDKLMTDFYDRPDLATVIYDFAANVDKRNNGAASNLSKEIYNKVTSNFPNSMQAQSSSLNERKTDIFALIDSSDDVNAINSVGILITDFRGNQNLPEAIYRIGEKYWEKAVEAKKNQADSKAKEAFTKAADVWEKIEELIPVSYPDVVEYTYHGLSICFQQIGDYKKATEYYNKILAIHPDEINDFEYENRDFIAGNSFCGAYAVWHTLEYYGFQASIDDIVKEMGIEAKGYSSISDIVNILQNKGISARGVKLSLDNLKTLTMPFIQYQAPLASGSIGHFVLCIPIGMGRILVLDGAEEPKIIELSVYSSENIKETHWDGTAVLIEGVKPELKQEVMSWNHLLKFAYTWLDENPDSTGPIRFNELTVNEQSSIKGGWDDWDCHSIGDNCYDVPACQHDEDCQGQTYVCDDHKQEENCVLTHYGVIPCTWDPRYTCNHKTQMTGTCQPGYRCPVLPENYGECNPLRTLFQCHNGW